MDRDAFYASLVILVPFLLYALQPYAVVDLTIWIRAGDEIFQQGTIYIRDQSSVLKTTEQPYPWLICVLYDLLYRAGGEGLSGLIFVASLHRVVPLIWGMYWVREIHRGVPEGKSPWTIFTLLACIVSIFGMMIAYSERPALVAYVPFLITADLLSRHQEGTPFSRREISKLAALFVVWVNVHHSFPLFFVLFAAYAVLRANVREWNWIPLFIVLSGLNPWGYSLYGFIRETAAVSKSRHILEWSMIGSVPRFQEQSLLFLGALGSVLIALFLRGKKHLLFHPIFPIAVSAVFAIRNTALFFLLLPDLSREISGDLGRNPNRRIEGPRRQRANAAIVLLLFAFGVLLTVPPLRGFSRAFLPETHRREFGRSGLPGISLEISRSATPTGSIFSDAEYAGFLNLITGRKTFVDARNTNFADDEFRTFVAAFDGGQSAIDYLNRHDVVWVVTACGQRPLIETIRAQGWVLRMEENRACLFSR